MKYAIYAQHVRDEKLFSSDVKDQLSQPALRAWYRISVSVLAPVVTQPTVVVDLSETQNICHKGKRWVEKWGEAEAPANVKMGREFIGVSCKQVWQDLTLSATQEEIWANNPVWSG